MTEYKFLVILFKNNSKKKIINKFVTFDRAKKFYKKLLDESKNTIFPKNYSNGVKSEYELSIISSDSKLQEVKYVKDEFGRQIKLELENSGFKIIDINPYNVEEEFIHYKSKKKYNSKKFIDKFLKHSGIKLISKLNNKIVLQNDEKIELFTLKNDDDASRFIDCINNFFSKTNRMDCILVKDVSTAQRKYLYNILVENGFPKSYLFRHSTTHPTNK